MLIIMASIVGIDGLVTGVIIAPGVRDTEYSLFSGCANLAGGLSVALTGLTSGMCLGVAGDAAARAMSEQPRLIMGAMLILIFGEVLGLYEFIILMSEQQEMEFCINDNFLGFNNSEFQRSSPLNNSLSRGRF
jgi:V-type H+-transporting ATPase proteolipid subunit